MYKNKKKLKKKIHFKVFSFRDFLKNVLNFFEILQRKQNILITDLYFTV
jgi:hypothetical protein